MELPKGWSLALILLQTHGFWEVASLFPADRKQISSLPGRNRGNFFELSKSEGYCMHTYIYIWPSDCINTPHTYNEIVFIFTHTYTYYIQYMHLQPPAHQTRRVLWKDWGQCKSQTATTKEKQVEKSKQIFPTKSCYRKLQQKYAWLNTIKRS